jgi:hypothetical protein
MNGASKERRKVGFRVGSESLATKRATVKRRLKPQEPKKMNFTDQQFDGPRIGRVKSFKEVLEKIKYIWVWQGFGQEDVSKLKKIGNPGQRFHVASNPQESLKHVRLIYPDHVVFFSGPHGQINQAERLQMPPESDATLS